MGLLLWIQGAYLQQSPNPVTAGIESGLTILTLQEFHEHGGLGLILLYNALLLQAGGVQRDTTTDTPASLIWLAATTF